MIKVVSIISAENPLQLVDPYLDQHLACFKYRIAGLIAKFSKSSLRLWSEPGGCEFKSRRRQKMYFINCLIYLFFSAIC